MTSIRSRAPKATSLAARAVMLAIPSRNTTPEVSLRRVLHRLGLRYRIDTRPETSIRCTADIVFRRKRVCIFVDGCFWHGCPYHFSAPKSNTLWWAEKIADNRRRDRRQTLLLRAAEWQVLRFWEHEIVKSLDRCVDRIRATL